MEEEKEQDLASTSAGDTLRDAALVQPSSSIAVRQALTRLLRKRLKKFVALAPQVSAAADTKIIHDVRVWSRRLQQAIGAFFPKPRSGKVRRLRRTPRRLRRALGEWRNCDVLLEMVARRQRRTRSDAKRRAWEFVRAYLQKKRSKEVARAGKKLSREEPGDYASSARWLLTQAPEENPELLVQRLHDSVQAAWLKWQSALARARETRAVSDLHGLRIATKALRYRTELLYDVGRGDLKPQLKWLASLQDDLGEWHDRQVLYQSVADAVGRADVLLTQLPAARILLAEVEAESNREAQAVEKIFRLASEHADSRPLSAAQRAGGAGGDAEGEAVRNTKDQTAREEVNP